MYCQLCNKNNEDRYKGYTIRQLCQEMHDLYVSRNVKQLQKDLFRKATLPEYVLNPHDANIEFVRNKVELVPLTDIVGRVAAEGALPYPPGVLCVVPGGKMEFNCTKILPCIRRRYQHITWLCT